MIKSINASVGLAVAGGSMSYPYIDMTRPSAGMVRYNGSSQNFEIYDGSTWMTMYSAVATVSMDYEVQTILNWARDKMAEDLRLKELAQRHPGIADLQEKLAVMIALVQQQEKTE
jgi:hypothetical protein